LAEAKSLLQELRRSAGRSLPPQYYGFREQVNEREGNEAAAVATLVEALQRFPENNEFRMNLAYYRLHAGDIAKAEALGREAIKRDVRFTRAYILLATVAERRADQARVADLLAKAAALEPQNLSLKIRYAHSLGRAGATEKMLVICRELLQQDFPALSGDTAEIRSRVIAVLAELGQGQRYDSQIRQLLNTKGNEAEGWDNLGQYLWRRKLSTEAERAFRQAVQMRPGVPAFHVNLATLLLTVAIARADDALRRQALTEFNLAIDLDQKSVLAYNGRASAYKFGGQVNEALADWQTAITLRPTFPEPYLNSGITLLEAGRRQEALERFRTCLRQCGRQLGEGEKKRLERLLSEAQR
jgi:tetratricopeptide (TPR) repeat protein